MEKNEPDFNKFAEQLMPAFDLKQRSNLTIKIFYRIICHSLILKHNRMAVNFWLEKILADRLLT